MHPKRFSPKPAMLAKLGAVTLALGLALTGCAGGDSAPGKTTETTLSKTDGGAETTVTYIAEGDSLKQQITKNVVNYELSQIPDRAAAEEQVGGLVEKFQGIPGVEHSIEFGDTELVETVTLTYADLDVEKLALATGADPGDDPEGAKKVSLKEAVATLTGAGFTEQK